MLSLLVVCLGLIAADDGAVRRAEGLGGPGRLRGGAGQGGPRRQGPRPAGPLVRVARPGAPSG